MYGRYSNVGGGGWDKSRDIVKTASRQGQGKITLRNKEKKRTLTFDMQGIELFKKERDSEGLLRHGTSRNHPKQ